MKISRLTRIQRRVSFFIDRIRSIPISHVSNESSFILGGSGMGKSVRVFLFLLVCLSFLAGTSFLYGQDVTGSIVGVVTDPSGAVVPGAKVTVTNTDKNAVIRELATNSDGMYVASLLPIGHYSVAVEAAGFSKHLETNINLHVNDKLTINVALRVGDVSQEVTVEASPLQVELQSATQAGLISGTQVRELSLNNRNYEQLVSLMPGVTSSASDQIYLGVTNPSGQTNVVSFSVNGNRNSTNNWTVDGADNVDRGSNLTLLTYPSVDAIAEFKVLRGLYNPEFGRAAGGQINVVTKSGTNQFHGNAYEFFRNDKLNANSFFNNANNIARPPVRYNDFGYTIGGPVYIPGHYNQNKDKTFFFFSQEFRRQIAYSTVTGTVPTSAEKAGNFQTPVCVAFSGTTCTQTGTSITNINPVAAAYIRDIWSKIPDPQNSATHQLFTPFRSIFNARQELVRIDQIFGPRLQIFGRYIHDSIPTVEPGGLFTGSGLPGVATTNSNSPGYSWVFRGTSTLSPTWLNEFGYAFSYGAIVSDPVGLISTTNSPDVRPTLPFTSTLDRVPTVSYTSGASSITSFGQYRDYNRNHQFYDNMTKVIGRHTFKFGFTYFHYQKTENAGGNNTGTFNFTWTGRQSSSALGSFSQTWANFLLGNVNQYTQASLDLTPDIRTQQYEMYFQDEFRLRSNLTLTYGLRYSQFRQPIDHNGFLTNFDPTLYNPANAVKIDPSNGNVIPNSGDPLDGIIIANKNSPYGSKVANESNKNIAPRIGLAWDPFGNGKTSIRAGYGIFYDSVLFGVYEQNIFTNPPYVQSIVLSNTQFATPASGTQVISSAPKSVRGTPNPMQTPYAQNWSLDIQRQLTPTWLIDVGYFGNKGTHLLGIVDLNEVPPGVAYSSGLFAPGTVITSANTPRLNAIRPYQGFVAVNSLETWFNSIYNSLQVSVQKQFNQGSFINFAYTWSRALTNNQTDRSTAPQNVYNINGGEYGPSQIDRTQVLTINYVYELPWLRSQQGLVGHLLGGWQISGITTIYTGLPLTVTTSGVDPGALGFLGPSAAGGRPDLVGDPNNGPKNVGQFFNTAAFALVPTGVVRPGNEGRGVVRGPGVQRWDFSFFKNVKIRESMRVQLRAEMFNVFNHTNYDGVATGYGTTTFGRVTSTRDPRNIQLGLKFSF